MLTLNDVFEKALQRIDDKGAKRHGGLSPFYEQPIFSIPKNLLSDNAPYLFQAVKKIYESRRLTPEASEKELLDAIVYIACAIIHDTRTEQA